MNDTAATVAEQGATVPTEKASSTKSAREKKAAPKATKSAPKGKKSAKPAAAKKGTTADKRAAAKPERTERTAKSERTAKASAPRVASKGAQILEMIGQGKGATLAEIMKATGWQAHSVRGFISTVGKKHNVKIESSKNESGDRLYRIVK